MRRELGVMLVAALVAAVCVAAGAWQWHRHELRVAERDRVSTNYDAAPVPLAELVAPGEALAAADVWRPVSVVGEYLPDATVLLRNRPVDGRPAWQVLEQLRVTEGELAGALLVLHRGWVPLAGSGQEAEPPPVPEGTVQVLARLRAAEPDRGGTTTPGLVRSVAVERVREASGADAAQGGPLLDAYGLVVTEDGAAPDGVGPLPRPEVGLGTNLSYAFQWWVFAVGALVGGAVLVRRDRLEAAGRPGPDGPREGPARPRPVRRRRRPTAEEEEDALIERQEQGSAAR